MKKIVAILLVVALVAAGFLIVLKNNQEKTQLREEALLSEEITRLQAERNQVQRQIDDAWEQYEVAMRGGDHCLVLFYDNMTPNLIEEIYPVVSGDMYNFTGVMTMYDLQMPGDEGCITWDDYNMLVENGWDFAIGTGSLDLSGDNSINVLDEYLTQYKAIFDENGLEFPITFCFGEGQHDFKYNSVLKEHGFKVVRHFGENYDLLTSDIEIDGLYFIGTSVMKQAETTLKADLSEVKAKELTFSVTVRYILRNIEDENMDCTYSRYSQMLNFIKNMNVMTATELCEYKKVTLTEAEAFLETFEEDMAAMEEDLAEIDAKIAELTVQ